MSVGTELTTLQLSSTLSLVTLIVRPARLARTGAGGAWHFLNHLGSGADKGRDHRYSMFTMGGVTLLCFAVRLLVFPLTESPVSLRCF